MAKDGRKPKHRHTDHDRATAVARVLAGESRRKVAAAYKVSDATVRRWIASTQSRATAREENLADKAEKLAGDLIGRQEQVRAKLLERIDELVPKTESLREVATAYGIVTDKALLAQGRPTGIHEHRASDPLDAEIEQLLDEEAAKRARTGAS